ncbi:efflux RND transporter periplasmic adaptor subunit [Chitinophaga sp.]|uniref:efflux RND transporter periplasmic adaptor subunit n=1 Tax=Chitinophaga sp. TaxID=1869181 RepID=UPI0031D2FF9C
MKLYISIMAMFLVAVSCKQDRHKLADHSMDTSHVLYTCSMHPQVVSDKPGKCPICHMDLVPFTKNNNDTLQLSGQQIQLGNIHTDTIKVGSMADQIVRTGVLNFDQDQKMAVSARVGGRLEKLYYKNVGDYVKKGSPLFDIYSEDLNNAKQEYLLALEKDQSFNNGSAIDVKQLVQSGRNKLLLWGMTERQINQLAADRKSSPVTTFYSPVSGYVTAVDIIEGGYAMDGESVVKLAALSTLWAEAQVYTYQLSDIAPNSLATVRIPDVGDLEIAGKIAFVNPEIDPSTKINLVRVSIPNKENLLKPGMPVYVIFHAPKHASFSLPVDAVLRDGKKATVWVQVGQGRFQNRMVETGLETDGRIEIIAGIAEGDIVVTSGAYLLNSEYIFKNGADPMAGHDMSKM